MRDSSSWFYKFRAHWVNICDGMYSPKRADSWCFVYKHNRWIVRRRFYCCERCLATAAPALPSAPLLCTRCWPPGDLVEITSESTSSPGGEKHYKKCSLYFTQVGRETSLAIAQHAGHIILYKWAHLLCTRRRINAAVLHNIYLIKLADTIDECQ